MGSALFDGWLSAWNNHDAVALAALMTEDGIYEIKPTGRVLTRATIANVVVLRHRLSSDFSVEYRSTQQDGHRYAAEWSFSGTNDGGLDIMGVPATGKTMRIEGASIGVEREGKIEHHTEYWDLGALMTQLGLPLPSALAWGLSSLADFDNSAEDE
jgi:steroid delta-isomerase-like uncharacterized protein